jgi:hypothetical protein
MKSGRNCPSFWLASGFGGMSDGQFRQCGPETRKPPGLRAVRGLQKPFTTDGPALARTVHSFAQIWQGNRALRVLRGEWLIGRDA